MAARRIQKKQRLQARLIFERQWLHALLLLLLLVPVVSWSRMDAVQAGALWGVPTPRWFWLAIAVAIVHQTYVWFCWRTELHGALLTRRFGRGAFPLYLTFFAALGFGRVGAVLILAISNRDSIKLDIAFLHTLAVIAFVPSLYLFYSVARYFGFKRAAGIDHFDPAYRSMPLVREGIFEFTSNGMYTYGFLLLWAIGFWYASAAALAAAAFSHAYIWVHYLTTEQPDMQRIYGAALRRAPPPA